MTSLSCCADCAGPFGYLVGKGGSDNLRFHAHLTRPIRMDKSEIPHTYTTRGSEKGQKLYSYSVLIPSRCRGARPSAVMPHWDGTFSHTHPIAIEAKLETAEKKERSHRLTLFPCLARSTTATTVWEEKDGLPHQTS
jgi:hypothetical protein